MPSPSRIWGLVAGLGLLAAVVAACGGGSSSSSGPSGFTGSSGAVIQGQIVQASSAALRESAVVVVLRTTLGIGLAEAAAGDPVAGATVTLTGTGGTFTTTTSTDGNFVFTNIPAGTYTIQVVDNSTTPATALTLDATSTSSITVGTGDIGTISGRVTTTTVALTVHVDAVDVSSLLQNEAQLCHAVSIATATGKNLEDVIDARLAGGGWGNVARQFGAPSSVLGNNTCTETQINQAGNVASGKAKGKGKGNAKGKGKGLS